MYINNFDLQQKSFNTNRFHDRFMDYATDSFGNYASFHSNEDFYSNKSNNNSIMVVPFPVNPHTSSSKIGLVDISTDTMKELRTNIK